MDPDRSGLNLRLHYAIIILIYPDQRDPPHEVDMIRNPDRVKSRSWVQVLEQKVKAKSSANDCGEGMASGRVQRNYCASQSLQRALVAIVLTPTSSCVSY